MKMDDQIDDQKIIKLFFERKEEAITHLAQKYGSVCLKISRNILGNLPDAEECVNDTYFAAWNSIPPQEPNPLLAYICRIVRNISIKKYHKNKATKRNSIYDVVLHELEECISAPENVEDYYSVKELAYIINKMLAGMSEENRKMFVRRYWFADSIPEIAKMFNVSEHNVSVRLSRTRNLLKKYLEKEGIYV